MMLFVKGNSDAFPLKSMSNPVTNQFQQISLQSTKGLAGVTFLMAQDSGQANRVDMAGERTLVQMPPSIWEIAVFQGLIHCCLSFVYFPLKTASDFQLQILKPWMVGEAGVTPAGGASGARSLEGILSTCPQEKCASAFNYKAYPQLDVIWL